MSEVVTNMVGSESWHDSITLAIFLFIWLNHPKATKKDLVKASFMDYLYASDAEVKELVKAPETGSSLFSSALTRRPDIGLRRLSVAHNRSGFLSCWKDLFQVIINVLSYTLARHRADEFHALLSKWKIGDTDPHHSLVAKNHESVQLVLSRHKAYGSSLSLTAHALGLTELLPNSNEEGLNFWRSFQARGDVCAQAVLMIHSGQFTLYEESQRLGGISVSDAFAVMHKI